MRVIAIAKSKDDNLTPAQRVHKIDRAIDDIKKPPSLMTKFKRFMTDPIIFPKPYLKED
jgi:hypothetical protein